MESERNGMDAEVNSGQDRQRQVVQTIFMFVIVGLALFLTSGQVMGFQPHDWVKFISYLVIGSLASALRVRLPVGTGDFPISFLFILISIVELSLPETLIVGVVLTFIDSLRMMDGQRQVRSLVTASAITVISIGVADVARHAVHLPNANLDFVAQHLVSGLVFWMVSAVPMSTLRSIAPPYPRLVAVLWNEYLPALPFYVMGMVAVLLLHSLNTMLNNWYFSLFLVLFLYVLYRSYVIHLARVEDQGAYADEMAALHLRTIEALALAIDAKDDTTADHLHRVQVYALELGRELGLSKSEMQALHVASLLHDIGKLAVPEYIISKPGKLTPEEFEKMKIHPSVGAEIIERVGFPYPVAPIVRAHHERWDGSGYPNRLAGEEIPIGARILSAVDTLDALASDRQYRKALPLDEAMARVRAESGRAFDPQVVELLSRKYEEFERKARNTESNMGKLSREIRIVGGISPAAGFEQVAPSNTGQFESQSESEVMLKVRDDLEKMLESASRLQPPMPLAEVLSLLSTKMVEALPFEAFVFYAAERNTMVPTFASGVNRNVFLGLSIPMGQGLSGWVAENRMPILNGNPGVEPGYAQAAKDGVALVSALAVPVEHGHEVLGVMAFYHSQRDSFSRLQLRIAEAVAVRLGSFISRLRRQMPAMGELTLHLPIPKANALEDYFSHLPAEAPRCSLLLARLSGFPTLVARTTPDELPYAAGRLLDNLRRALGSPEHIFQVRQGEFAAIMPAVPDPVAVEDQLSLAARNFAEASRFLLDDATLDLGVAVFPAEGRTLDQLLGAADRHMYQFRERRNNTPWAVTPGGSMDAARIATRLR